MHSTNSMHSTKRLTLEESGARRARMSIKDLIKKDPLVEKLYQTISHMLLFGIENDEICSTLNITQEELIKITTSSPFDEIFSKAKFEEFEKRSNLENGWDSVENLSLRAVVQELEYNPDPEFALRAAMIANKAKRHVSPFNKPINGDVGARAVISLPISFIQSLEKNTMINNISISANAVSANSVNNESTSANRGLKKKVIDLFSPESLEKIIQSPSSSKNAIQGEVSELFNNFNNFEPATR